MSTISSPLVGSAIIGAREMVPDLPPTLPQPTAAISVINMASTLPQGTYFGVVTQLNSWGETIGSVEVSGLVVGLNQALEVTSPQLPGAVKMRIYLTLPLGATAGSEIQFVESTIFPITIISTPLTLAGTPPLRNTAWLPDSDGGFISASAIYRWLNQGLSMIVRETGGYTDYSGVPSVSNQPLYVIPGEWNEITAIWYDGYWMSGGDRGMFFRRNTVSSQVLSQASVSHISNRNVLEVYPQPARNGTLTTLSSPMIASDTVANLTSTAGFLLPFGFFQVDIEIMAYGGINGNQLTGLIRGLGGSAASAHATNAPTSELNIFWSGRRQTTQFGGFTPGQCQSVLPIPSGWEFLLISYMAGRAKIAEHDNQAYSQFLQEIRAEVKEWARTDKGIATRRQIGGSGSPTTYYGDIAGGIIVP